ncbi:hypothetical protein [uncultured Chryseobacterium sp.]|uniref:hypothetical protein n=1 Tax=uncultured Chryseobacterium sp. TaxID=259322 RepID=UPI002617DAA0|nr:hypothetical protein [uncultured Chryseobacterium sp.]
MKKYYILAAAVVIFYFVQSFFLSAGGIGADSLSYFGIAADLPHPETNLFPLGFPISLKFFHLIFQDWFWASKFLNFSLIVGILLFSYFKKFYLRETVLLFTGKTLFFVYTNVMSESFFIFLLYLMLYFFHQRFKNQLSSGKFLFWSSLLMILMVATRYAGIYIFAGIGLFYFLILNKTVNYKKDMLKFLLISGLGIFGYLLLNQITFGSFAGEDLRGKHAAILPIDVFRNFLGVTNVIDPFIGIKPASNSFASLAFQVLLMVLDFVLLYYIIKLFKKKKETLQLHFHYLLYFIAGTYTVLLFVSGFFQQIEEMNIRMLAAANFCLFFSFLIIYFTNLKNDKIIFGLGCFFLIFLSLYNIKVPDNYLKNKKEIEMQMPKFSSKKYLYNNERGKVAVTEYKIPFTGKTIQYNHTSQQPGDVKLNIAGTINPKIKWIKKASLVQKKNVLYTSELHLGSESH